MNTIVSSVMKWISRIMKNPKVQKAVVKGLEVFFEIIIDAARKKYLSEKVSEEN